MDKWKVCYYISASGNNPVKEFLDSNPKSKVKAFRILYVTRQEKQVLLLHAFVKKTKKTPLREINIALTRLNESRDLTK